MPQTQLQTRKLMVRTNISQLKCKLTVGIPSDVYALAGWPIVNAEAEDARQEMLQGKTHEVVPLPAYDIKGNLIKPEKYRVALAGALARICFTMAHWYIPSAKEPTNCFVADVKSIRVLTDPVMPKSPTKRKTTKREIELVSPSSRRRRTDHMDRLHS